MPALGFSLFLIAVGAVLAFAINVTTAGVDLAVIGGILMAVGALGLVMSMLFWTSFAPFGHRDETVVHRDVDTHAHVH